MATIPPDRARPAPADAAAAAPSPAGVRPAGVTALAVQLLGDAANVAFGVDRRAVVGLPVAAALILYLSRPRVGAYFDEPERRGRIA